LVKEGPKLRKRGKYMRKSYAFLFMIFFLTTLTSCAATKHVPSEAPPPEKAKPMPAEPVVVTDEPASNVMDCYVKLWGEKDFLGHSVTIRPPDLKYAEYPNKKNLPEGIFRGWGQHIESLEVGRCADAEVFAGKNFAGVSGKFKPDSAIGNIESVGLGDVYSIKVTCACSI
jgi:hypothetical protein